MGVDQENSRNSIPTTGTVEIEYSRAKLFGLAAIGLLFVAAGAAMVLFPGPRFQVFIGYFAAAFFGLGAIKAVWSLLCSSGPIITITPEGIRDTRIASKFIPWSGIARISTWSYRGNKALVLMLKPGVNEEVALTWLARLTRIPNYLVGVDGFAIMATGLKTDYQTLLQTILSYARAYSPHIALTA
jgi:hypothetical protein